jgi:glutamate 5-kinase
LDGGWQHRADSSARCGKKTDQDIEAMGKSRGGLSTKIHAAVDALGNPVRLLLTPGQASEYGPAEALIEGFAFEAVLAAPSRHRITR